MNKRNKKYLLRQRRITGIGLIGGLVITSVGFALTKSPMVIVWLALCYGFFLVHNRYDQREEQRLNNQ